MFNIGEKTEIINLEKTGCTLGHIQQCISDRNKHDNLKCTYWGKYVSKGTVILHTVKGDFTLRFDEKNGCARRIEIL